MTKEKKENYNIGLRSPMTKEKIIEELRKRKDYDCDMDYMIKATIKLTQKKKS